MSGKEKDRGQTSTVLKVFPDTNKILLKDVNVVTRHLKKQGTTPGQIIKMEKAIDASNVMLICPFTEKPTRVGFVKVEEK
ncbi:MAG: 50S ribosomal protein L24 [Patescibacteria group bacterium]|nr:50S ribosomal protein L24 [Patescibacteria group bacterium]